MQSHFADQHDVNTNVHKNYVDVSPKWYVELELT